MRRNAGLMFAAVALIALPGCGSSGGQEKTDAGGAPRVATLQSGPATPSAAAPVKTERPRERLDMTAEEYEVLLEPYNKCMREQGFDPVGSRKKAGLAAEPSDGEKAKAAERANQVCEPQFLPLPPWEKDPANPEARDFALDVVKCLKREGVKFVEVGEDGVSIALGGDRNDKRSITLGMDRIPDCEREVAAKS
ncbi:hypothetical protein AMIS_26110 [Actinoplanes missouriensis 431]|uniref:Uncharacterized protein n=1 Tax=Actinoplanes missouriensis (strain ATCC 14538 / DSM 43046 / CBS 188.64 / JCM 3121 / NBRC 102363 / NCIMB 12654 / NRRL B-3342 / UNCC 431) TaxID=512565 RepID=I0H494_ACTM4|nr:hypothetical protein [Actinoplanes missouriensis]BAL87831.1 hypothetical protein AMIS_26110 [Actinoplanes missouriensis 431]